MLKSSLSCAKKIRNGLVVSVTILLLLSGCMSQNNSASGEQQVLRIALADSNGYANALGDYLTAAFPDLKVELVEMEPDYKPVSIDQYEKKLRSEKPDLLLLGFSGKYAKLAADGMLEDVAVRLRASEMKEEDFYPGMIEKLRRDGGGNLYALAPAFQASVLYYNADLFRKYGIEPPRNGMTIMDVMRMAGDFAQAGSHKDEVVGYHQPLGSMPNSLLFTMSSAEGLQSYNFKTGKVTMDSPAWRKLIETVVDLYKKGAFLMQDIKGDNVDGTVYYGPEEMSEADLFKKGKSAMTLASYNEFDGLPFEVGMVTPPVSSMDTNRTDYLGIYDYMAIPAGARNADTAWQVIAFMMSDYVAKVKAGIRDTYSMPANKAYLTYDREPMLPSLYELLPSVDSIGSMEGYDPKFMQLFQELEDREIMAAVNGEQSVEACIAAIQKEGQALLDAAKLTK
ncbi:ABC transporter substrate-binding protein [Paenibacillus silvisoli]|uniref:ABC transporter substrate-binding protein n=1 Tax=Paenibacillus silvisoli TaxID=3110539 RepID=UPI002804917B|nr:extracellular solute-binding protein [Paenibacillus silvisoli]